MTAGWFNDLNTKLANIFASGSNIGIGQSNPTAKLDVNGNGSFSGIVSANTPIAPSNVTTKAYVDAAIVSAAGGGGSCYYTTLPLCTNGYSRAPGLYHPTYVAASGYYENHYICCPASYQANGCTDNYPGSSCTNKAIYAFYLAGNHYMTTPGNCDNLVTPFCNGSADSLTKQWSTETVLRNATSISDGSGNTTILMNVAGGVAYPAAKYCADMVYGGYSDWFLPSKSELHMLFTYKSEIGGFDPADYYWSSTESNSNGAWYQYFTNGSQYGNTKTDTYYVRCIRKI